MAESVVIPLGISYNLFQDVAAQDEIGEAVLVAVENDGGFDVGAKSAYTVAYIAEHPSTGERFGAERSVRVYLLDAPQPQTIEESPGGH